MLGTTSSPSPPPTTNKGAPGGEAAPMAEEGSSKEGCSGCGCGCGGGDDDCWPLAVLVLMEMVGRRVRGSMENFMPPPNDARLLRLLLLLLLLLPAGDASSPPLGTATVLLPLLLPSRERLMPASRFSLLPPCSCPRARCRLVLRGRADDVWTCCCCDCSGEAEADEEEAAAAAAAGAGGGGRGGTSGGGDGGGGAAGAAVVLGGAAEAGQGAGRAGLLLLGGVRGAVGLGDGDHVGLQRPQLRQDLLHALGVVKRHFLEGHHLVKGVYVCEHVWRLGLQERRNA